MELRKATTSEAGPSSSGAPAHPQPSTDDINVSTGESSHSNTTKASNSRTETMSDKSGEEEMVLIIQNNGNAVEEEEAPHLSDNEISFNESLKTLPDCSLFQSVVDDGWWCPLRKIRE